LSITAPLVIMLKDRFELDPLSAVLIAAALPTLLMPASIPLWSRLLDRMDVIRFRAIHSWAFVASTAFFLAGAVARNVDLLWIGAVCVAALLLPLAALFDHMAAAYVIAAAGMLVVLRALTLLKVDTRMAAPFMRACRIRFMEINTFALLVSVVLVVDSLV